jgi:hypothetical protein
VLNIMIKFLKKQWNAVSFLTTQLTVALFFKDRCIDFAAHIPLVRRFGIPTMQGCSCVLLKE